MESVLRWVRYTSHEIANATQSVMIASNKHFSCEARLAPVTILSKNETRFVDRNKTEVFLIQSAFSFHVLKTICSSRFNFIFWKYLAIH